MARRHYDVFDNIDGVELAHDVSAQVAAELVGLLSVGSIASSATWPSTDRSTWATCRRIGRYGGLKAHHENQQEEAVFGMTKKKVEMAVRDPKTKKSVVDEVEVEVVTVTIRNRDLRQRGGHVYTSLVSGMTVFKPGEVKTLEISEDEVAEIKRHRNGAWELVTAAPTPEAFADTDEEDYSEPTSSQASRAAAEVDAMVADDDVAPQRRERVQRRRLR
jgi:hypothetical protein